MSTATLNHIASALPQGGGYAADQNPDGSWNIRDVPVFAAHKREGMPRVTRVWLERAVARAQADKAGGYVPPLHVAHHNSGQPVSAAGKFLLTRVADFAFAGGAPRPTAFADLLGVDQGTYDAIKAGKLPYRSIESADLRVPEINSLALLDHDAPYFKFPLLSIGSERPVAASAGSARVVFNATEGTMVRYSAGSQPVTGTAVPKAKFAADMAGAMAKAQEAAQAALAQFTETLGSIASEVSAMAESLGVSTEGGAGEPAEDAPSDEPMPEEAAADSDPTDEKDEDDMKPAEAPAKSAAMSAGTLPAGLPTAFKAQFAAMAGRLQALEGEVSTRRKADAKAVAVAKATKDLEGYAGNFAADIAEAYDLGGDKNLALYVRSVKAMGLPTPPENFTGDLPASSAEPTEVTAYAMAGQTQLREARRMHAVYSASPSWLKADTPLDKYLATQMGPPPAKK